MSLINVIENKFNNVKYKIETLFLPRTLECVVNGKKILILAETGKELKRAKSYETKEPNTLKWIMDFIKPDDVFYDIGANIGLYSIFPAVYEPKCRVYSFEPESLNFAKINKNIHLNRLSSKVVAYPIALSSSIKLDKFFINKFRVGNALHSFGKSLDNMKKEFKPDHVQGSIGFNLDYLVFDLGLEFPNHVKIDVDGIERDVVSGGEKVFSDNRVRSVLVEISRDEDYVENREWFNEFFYSKGFVLSDYEEKRKDTENLIFKRV
ncbi:MAG: FkbM family methyltransferase [Parcubacteria group bacterium]